ncbi:MAG TPA: hypothetical protein PLF54_14500, partial [Deltaproteobacteria bacterium]|nr:hypothetical protein [Deltaproteobacteria bacterium]
ENWHSIFLFAIPVSMEMDVLLYSAESLMPGSTSLLQQEVESGVSRASLLRLAAFLLGLEDAGPDGVVARTKRSAHNVESFGTHAAGFCSSLRFSTHAARMLKRILGKLSLTRSILSRKEIPRIELYRFCKDIEDYLPEALLLALAWGQSHDVGHRRTASMIWEYYRDIYAEYQNNPLVTGDDIMKLLGRPAGPDVGKCLQRVEEARAGGIVRTKSEALKFLKSTSR